MDVVEYRKDKKFWYMAFIFSLLIIIFSMHNFDKNSMPYIYNDEFGYWVSAAKYTGYDWSGIFNQISYYSYGYGLILALLLKLTNNMALVYKMALALNGIWLVGSFCLLYLIGKKLYPKISDGKILFLSFLITCLPGNITQANYTWPENLLFFLFCLLTFVLLKMIERPGMGKGIALSGISMFAYAVHQRTLVFIIAVSMTLLLLLLLHRLDVKDLIVFVGGTVCFFLIHSWLKEDICSSIWANGEALAINNIEGQVDKINSILSLAGFRNLILSVFGKIFYLIAASQWLICFFVERNLIKLKDSALCLIRKKWKEVDVFAVFLFLILCGTIGIGAIFMIKPSGTVHIVYGRYNEHILGPFLLIALAELQECKCEIKRFFCYFGFTFLMAVGVLYSIRLFSPIGIAELNAVGLASYVKKESIDVWLAVLVSFTEFLVIREMLCSKAFWKKVGYVLCLLIWLGMGNKAYDLFSTNGLENAVVSTKQCVDAIAEVEEEKGTVNVIYAMSGGTSYPSIFSGNGLQYLLPDRKMEYITASELQSGSYDKNCILIYPVDLEKPDGFYISFKSEFYYVAIPETL